MNAIVAVSSNWGIGYNNDLLFNIPEDKKYFRSMTIGKTVVMGRKTLESLPGGRPFKDRTNIVLSRNSGYTAPEGVILCRDVNELPDIIGSFEGNDVFVVGGADIYSLMLPYCSTVYVTKIDAVKPADKYFPNLDSLFEWKLTDESEEHEFDGLKYKFCAYTDISHL